MMRSDRPAIQSANLTLLPTRMPLLSLLRMPWAAIAVVASPHLLRTQLATQQRRLAE
jgi:hypothetical protein